MADLTATRDTTLPPDEVLVRAVQFFTNERWRAQSQTTRIATFVGVGRVPWTQILIALLLTMCLVIPGVIYYLIRDTANHDRHGQEAETHTTISRIDFAADRRFSWDRFHLVG